MKTEKLDLSSQIAKALELLDQGEVVGLPTETVYGLAARVDRPAGLAKIFQVKERPLFDPLIVHVSSLSMAQQYVKSWPRIAQSLALKFWPGPLTLVLPKSELVPAIVTSGLETVGLRMPRPMLALNLISQAGVGLAAPSANRFGRTSPTRWEHVQEEFKNAVFILQGDPCEVGIESTVLEIRDSVLVLHRLGSVSRIQIESELQNAGLSFEWLKADEMEKRSPGQMKHHYMPAVPLLWTESALTAQEIREKYLAARAQIPDTVEGVQLIKPEQVPRVSELRLSENPQAAARELYHQMRVIAQNADLIYFQKQNHMSGEDWSPILERLTKAASLKLD